MKSCFWKLLLKYFYVCLRLKKFIMKYIFQLKKIDFIKYNTLCRSCEKFKNILLFVNYIKFFLQSFNYYTFYFESFFIYFLISSLKILFCFIFISTLVLILLIVICFSLIFFFNWNSFIYHIWFSLFFFLFILFEIIYEIDFFQFHQLSIFLCQIWSEFF
jgi:hypothetical protein